MPTYKIRLASQTDEQSREVTLEARSEGEAAARVEAQERRLASYSIIPHEPRKPQEPENTEDLAAWEQYETDYAAWEAADAAYAEQRTDAEQRLAMLQERAEWDDAGRVRGIKGRDRADLHAHLQSKPYQIESIEQVKLGEEHISRLVSEISQLDKRTWKKALKELQAQGIPLGVVTGFLFGVPVKNQYDGTAVVNWTTDTIKTSLHTSTYTPSQDTHDFFNDITNEITGTGYTAGGVTLGTKSATYDTASDQMRLDAADATWASSTLTARYACVYKSTGTSTTSPVMGLVDFGADVSTSAGTFQITWDATGIVVIDVT